MSTIDPQVIHSFINSVALLAIPVLLAMHVRLAKKMRTETPTNSLVMELRAEVERFSGMVADLEDRFSRFQKREGMRVARAEKDAQKTLKEQAADLMAGTQADNAPAPGSHPKAALYKQLRGH